MGKRIAAFCDCGFSTEFRLGGNQSSFRSEAYFPHYCRTCGLVEVNIAQRGKHCPVCAGDDLQQYGKPPLSPSEPSSDIQWGDYKLGRTEHFCPACKSHCMNMEIAAFTD